MKTYQLTKRIRKLQEQAKTNPDHLVRLCIARDIATLQTLKYCLNK